MNWTTCLNRKKRNKDARKWRTGINGEGEKDRSTHTPIKLVLY
jgi:hypothetical protein